MKNEQGTRWRQLTISKRISFHLEEHMGIFDMIDKAVSAAKMASNKRNSLTHGVIGYGEQKSDKSHDHRYNQGNDRTPAQKRGDAQRRK
jgi:acyl CoA:acetate/3-ketoacid CoA transferase beta subunit